LSCHLSFYLEFWSDELNKIIGLSSGFDEGNWFVSEDEAGGVQIEGGWDQKVT